MESESNGTIAHDASNGHVTPGQADDDVLDVKSEAFRTVNVRRGELIYKKNREGLTPDEAAAYERLDLIVGAAIDRAFPRPTLVDDVLAAVEAHLRRERQSAHEATAAE